MPEKKVLRLEVVGSEQDEIKFKIAEQSHRGKKFGIAGDCYNEGLFVLCSVTCPSILEIPFNVFYVRGDDERYDDDIISCTTEQYMKIAASVESYNDYFSGNEKVVPNDLADSLTNSFIASEYTHNKKLCMICGKHEQTIGKVCGLCYNELSDISAFHKAVLSVLNEHKQVSSEDKKAWLLRMVDYVEEL